MAAELLRAEYPNVKRCVKRVLECNVTQLELAYAAALAQALSMYRTERRVRAMEGEALALELDALGPVGPYPCPVSATLFAFNHDVQSLLVSQDPLVKQGEEFLRTTIQSLASSRRADCCFDAVLDAYLSFAASHRDRVAARSDSPAAPPLGLRPHAARLGGREVLFPTAAAWAAFVANRTLWLPLRDAPAPAQALSRAPSPRRRVRVVGRGRSPSADRSPPGRRVEAGAPGEESRWSTVRRLPALHVLRARPTFLLAPDVDEWERAHPARGSTT